MHKEEDKLSLNMNEDFTLPNLEEGMEINEMPSIEDLISLDKDEVEKIQATEIADIFNENDNTNLFDDNIGENSSQNETTSAEFNSFDSNFEEMNLFDEDVALTLDEPNFNTSATEVNSFNEEQNFNNQSEYDNDNSSEVFSAEESFDNNTAENFAFEENTQNSTSNDELQQENLNIDENIETETSSFDNEFDMGEDNEIPFENEDLEFSLNEQNDEETLKTDILDNEKEMSTDEKDTPSNEIDSLDKVEKIINEQNENSNVTEDENINSIMEENTTTETIEDISLADKNSTYSKTDDVFAKIDSLLNDDSAFEVSSNTSNFENKSINENLDIEMPKSTFKSSFNPAKYINRSNTSNLSDKEDKLGILYAAKKVIDNIKTLGEELNSSENNLSLGEILKSSNGKKALVTAAVCVVVLGAGITGVSVFNNKSVEEIDSISKNDVSTPLEVENVSPTETTPAENRQNQTTPLIDENANVASDAPDLGQIQQPKVEVKQEVIKEEVKKQTKPVNTESYLTVKKIQWQVPDYLSYSPNIKSYLQTAGKSIKLGLSSDLLLATEYAYSNVVKINLKMSNSGAVQNANVVTSSGSKEIDNIVLQSVKTTLNVVKPPANEVKTPDFNLTITIYL